MARVCPACTNSNEDWRALCAVCGATLPPTLAPPPPPPPEAGIGAQWAPPWAPPPPPPTAPPSKRPGRAILIITLVVLLAGAGLFAVLRRGDSPYPSHWDPKVLDLVGFVEGARGHTFKHPVTVRYLDDAAFRKTVTRDPGSVSAHDRKAAAREIEFFRALGLAEGNVDLLAAANQLQGETVLAFYSPTTKSVTVRGTTLDVAHRVTIAHELTHALQDQYFGLAKLRQLGARAQTDAVTALIEGDARNVEKSYVKQLSASDRAAYEHQNDAVSSGIDLKGIPDALVIGEEFPYDFGPSFVRALRTEGGVARLDEAFRHPPTSEAQIVNPASFIDGDKPLHFGAVALPTGALRIDNRGEFGLVGWYLMLSEQINAHDALRAADGIGGDTFSLYTAQHRTCARIRFVGTDQAATDRMRRAIRRWMTKVRPGMAAISDAGGGTLLFDTCDPGATARLVTHHSKAAYSLPVLRAEILDEFLDAGAPLHAAACAANKVAMSVTPAQANDPKATVFKTKTFGARVRAWVAACTLATNAT